MGMAQRCAVSKVTIDYQGLFESRCEYLMSGNNTVLSAWAIFASFLVSAGCAPAPNSAEQSSDGLAERTVDGSSVTQPASLSGAKAVSDSTVLELRQLIENGHHDQAIARVEEQLRAQREEQDNEEARVIAEYLASELKGTSVGAHCKHYLILTEFEQFGLRRRLAGQLDNFLMEYPDSALPTQLYIAIVDQIVEQGQAYVANSMLTASIKLAKDHRDVEPLDRRLRDIKERSQKQMAARRQQLRSQYQSSVQAKRESPASDQKPTRVRRSAKYAALMGKRMRITGRTLDGSKVKSGQWTIVHFWATWCPSCRRNVPGLKEIQRQYDQKGVQLVGVSLDQDLAGLKQFSRRNGITWPQVVSDDLRRKANWNTPLVRKYGISSIPAVFLLSPEGKVVEAGLRGASSIANAIDYHLSRSS